MAKLGRKPRSTQWRKPEKLQEIQDMVASGIMQKDVAKRIGISPQVWSGWKNDFPEFADAVEKGMERRCKIAESSLSRLIEGYTYEETRTEIIMNGDDVASTKSVTIKKYAHPNIAAIIFYLTNEHPEKWKNYKAESAKDEEQGTDDGMVRIHLMRGQKPTEK